MVLVNSKCPYLCEPIPKFRVDFFVPTDANWFMCDFLFRYSAKRLPEKPTCTHKKNYQCTSLTMRDLNAFHSRYYKNKDKRSQDAFILKHIKGSYTSRRRPRQGNRKGKELTTKYYIYSRSSKKMIRVCQKTFINILDIKRYRVERISKNFLKEGLMPEDNRGGDRKSHKYLGKKTAIIEFIKKLKCSEPHYCRGSSARLYLAAELSINKLFTFYNDQAEEQLRVKRSYFRTVFNTNFNLGFGTPRTDVCSVCLQYTEKIKVADNERLKNDLIIQQCVHKKRAKAFFSYLKDESPNVYIFSFDCQKNMPLPKIPDQSTYYSRQFYLYNFTVVAGSSKSQLNKENTFAYVWTEDRFPKDSNLIASAIYHRLNSTSFPDEIDTVRLMADGCAAGQNKNTTVVGMCLKWLSAPQHIKNVEIIFPVVGHSFLPADRVFGRIEKEFRKRDTILEPNGYSNIIREYSSLISVGEECPVKDWKEAVKNIIKPVGTWHVPFSKCKRFILKRSTRKTGNTLVKGELHYVANLGIYKNVCKSGKIANMIFSKDIQSSAGTLKPSKIKDVDKLLTSHFDINWRSYSVLSFYDKLIPKTALDIDLRNADDENEHFCEEQESVPDLIV